MRGTPTAIIWSAPLTLAAVLAYGPQAAYVFLLSGLCVVGFRTVVRLWRTVLNMALWGLQGLVAAGVQILLVPGSGAEVPTTAAGLLGLGLLSALLIEAVNALVTSAGLVTLCGTSLRAELHEWLVTAFPWGAPTMVAPLEKRSVIESVRAGVPRRAMEIDTILSVAAPRRHRTGAPARNTPASGTTARLSLRPAASQSNIVPNSVP